MVGTTTVFSAISLGLGFVVAAPAPPASSVKCVVEYSGVLSTNQFTNSNGEAVFKPYYFNNDGYVAYDPIHPDGHTKIKAEFQTCTPNYAQESNGEFDDVRWGRFYLPGSKKCLYVTNPSGSPPYFVNSKACPTVADMVTKKSIPFNFVADGTGGEVDMRWYGGTIPSKGIWQGPNPPAQYCVGQYFVNATLKAVPITGKGDQYRVHLYCNAKDENTFTGYTSFTLL